MEATIKALVYRSTGSWYDLKDETGKKWRARLKGVLRIDNITSTNPIAVGDHVMIEPEDEKEDIATITGIEDRHNYISRQSPHNKNAHHIVASNLDQCMLIATLKDPRTSQGFIDRFLIAAEAYHVPALVVFNKADAWRKKEEDQFTFFKTMYERVGYPVFKMSVKDQIGLDTMKEALTDKKTLISGHSGVGKSSFLNAIMPGLILHTKEVSGWSGKGMHTTTFAEMFDLPGGGAVIDTPGMREFGLVHIERQELSHYFPEMREILNDCQFNNCLHVNEPGCAVKLAVTDLEQAEKPGSEPHIYEQRYLSYLSILQSIEENKW